MHCVVHTWEQHMCAVQSLKRNELRIINVQGQFHPTICSCYSQITTHVGQFFRFPRALISVFISSPKPLIIAFFSMLQKEAVMADIFAVLPKIRGLSATENVYTRTTPFFHPTKVCSYSIYQTFSLKDAQITARWWDRQAVLLTFWTLLKTTSFVHFRNACHAKNVLSYVAVISIKTSDVNFLQDTV